MKSTLIHNNAQNPYTNMKKKIRNNYVKLIVPRNEVKGGGYTGIRLSLRPYVGLSV